MKSGVKQIVISNLIPVKISALRSYKRVCVVSSYPFFLLNVMIHNSP